MYVANAASLEWYASGTVWGAAGVVAALLSIVVLAWVALRIAYPKRRLLYSMPVVTPLLNAGPDLPCDLEVRCGGAILRYPHVATVKLINKGRNDIRRDAFDGGEPLRLDVGATIIECLQIATWPSGRHKPLVKVQGSTLLIGPSLLGRRQTITFSMLVDGPHPALRKPEQTLVDIDIRSGDFANEPNDTMYPARLLVVIVIAALIGIALINLLR